jgi:phosphoribosylglycinamide formyltransferase-1
MEGKIRIGALISGGGTNLQAVIDACEAGQTGGQVVFVGSDNPDAKGLERAARHGIPSFVVDYRRIIRRYRQDSPPGSLPADFDPDELAKEPTSSMAATPAAVAIGLHRNPGRGRGGMLAAMAPYAFDLLILAGFMRNLTPYFIDRVNTTADRPRIMNIHPALLPAFPGTDGYGDTYRYGCKLGGCTVHFIDYGEDSGPIIGQRCLRDSSGRHLDDGQAKGLEAGVEALPGVHPMVCPKPVEGRDATFDLAGGRTMRARSFGD